MRVKIGHGFVDAFVVEGAGVMIENALLIGGDGQRHHFAASRLRESRIDVDQRLQTSHARRRARGNRIGGIRVGVAQKEIIDRRGRFEPSAAARQLE